MKQCLLYIAAVTALQLVRTEPPAPLLADKPSKQQLSMVTQYLSGAVTRKQLFEHAETAVEQMTWQNAVAGLKHHLPKYIVSMLAKHGEKQPFDEASLDKARTTLNGMIETAQAEYDLKDMECMAFDERNEMEHRQTVADLSRLGSNIAADNGLILASKADINNAIEVIAKEDKAMKAALGECEKTRLMNEMQLATLKNDLSVAEFIVSMTECKPGAELLQANSTDGTAPVIAGCPMDDGSTQLTFKDGFLASKAGMMLSKQGQQALRIGLLNSHPSLGASTQAQLKETVTAAHKVISALVTKYRVRGVYPDECVFPFIYYGVSYDTCSNIGTKGKGTYDYGWCATKVNKKGKYKVGSGNYAKCDSFVDAAAPTLAEIMNPPPPVPEPVPPKTEPTKAEAQDKCVLGKPDCGLLTDNMSIMWGECKDAVDELTSIMAENEKNCKATEDLHNGAITTWQSAMAQKNVELTEATGSLNTNTEEQSERQAEKLMIEKEYEEVHGECVVVLHEILFTNICGVKTVRGEIAKFSSVYGPTDVLDCVVTDWIPMECSITCVDQVICEGAVPGSKGFDPMCAGGTQNMSRNIVQNKSLGAECPAMLLQKGCNNHPCPVDCTQSSWSPFGKCSKECGSGIQQQSRNVEIRPDNGGEACGPSSNTESCNPQSCDIDCVLADWTVWGPCSRACGPTGGVQERARLELAPKEGNGLCALEESLERFEQQECNVLECPANPICIAKQDVILGVDVSGSLKQEGFDIVMQLVRDLVSLYTLGVNETQIGILEYSKEAKIVAPLQNDMAALEPMIEKINFQRGVTDMAQGLSIAKTILMEGRKSASSVVILLTDGKPSFQFSTRKAAQELRDMGVRVVIVPIFTYGNADFMGELASDPPEDNVLQIGGLKLLSETTMAEATNLMTSTCAELGIDENAEAAPAGKGGKGDMMSMVFNPPKQHERHSKTIYHRRGHNPWHADMQ